MGGNKTKFRLRAQSAFDRSRVSMDGKIEEMMGDHAAKGRLQSGATVKAAVRIFEDHSNRALRQTLDEAAKLIEHRGRAWTDAMDGMSEALDSHLAKAPEHLAKAVHVADHANTPSVAQAFDELLLELGTRLRGQIAEFRQGWTAPLAKKWQERHPLMYAVALLLIGAAVGLAVPLVKSLIVPA